MSGYEKTSGNSFDISAEWKSARSAWTVYRAHPSLDNDAIVFGRRFIVTVDQLEETSNLIYDPNISAQNLADITFAELPRLFENINRSAVAAERFAQTKQMILAERISLAVTARGLNSPIKTATDDLKVTRRSERKQTTAAANKNIMQLDAMLGRTSAWTRYADFQEKYVAVARPGELTIAQIERFRIPAVAATLAVRRGSTQLLAANIARRIETERTRRLLYQIGTVLAALFLVGIMLEIVRFVARRDREDRPNATVRPHVRIADKFIIQIERDAVRACGKELMIERPRTAPPRSRRIRASVCRAGPRACGKGARADGSAVPCRFRRRRNRHRNFGPLRQRRRRKFGLPRAFRTRELCILGWTSRRSRIDFRWPTQIV